MGSPDFELKIVSLVRYVDACSPANRHSDCPFVVEQQGERTCREECRGVIASLLRRGRNSPERNFQAFDARQLRLSEAKGAPDILWHTSSLLQVVVDAVRAYPITRDGGIRLRRFVDMTSALGALGCRGLDPDHLVRRGVARNVKLGLAAWLNRLERSDNPQGNWEHLNKWRTFFEEDVSNKISSSGYIRAVLHGPTSRRLDAWIESAPLEDIILWRPPASLPESLATAPLGEGAEVWMWIVDRFTQTYLERWSLSSLKKEYAFIQGLWQPSFPIEVLSERKVAQGEAATALADRTLNNDDLIDPAMMDALTNQAIALIEDGQRNAAAALLEGARMLNPTDMMTQNNYAFCILVDNPSQARSLLREALKQGLRNSLVTYCNIALAESLLGHTEAALEACGRAYQAAKDGRTAILWHRSDGGWVAKSTNVRAWTIQLGAELEEEAISDDGWGDRLKQLRLQDSSELE